jgi:hypothetical protein
MESTESDVPNQKRPRQAVEFAGICLRFGGTDLMVRILVYSPNPFNPVEIRGFWRHNTKGRKKTNL